jgi:nucleotide-binding universal stress UspA family protein
MMREPYSLSRCVVVGIDGSRSARKAALWAVDEAVDRDAPLRLVCAIDSFENTRAAEDAIRDAITAIESTGKPVKVEAEVAHDRPIAALLAESRTAAMVCVGSTGLKHAMHGRIGSTASALVTSAHCSVAVVPTSAVPSPVGCILALVDESPCTSRVLELAVREARLRAVQLRVLTTWPLHGSGRKDVDQAAAAARLQRYLAPWRRTHPTVDIEPVATDGGVIHYLDQLHSYADPVQLLVVDPRGIAPGDNLLGPASRATLGATRCVLLSCDRQHWL